MADLIKSKSNGSLSFFLCVYPKRRHCVDLSLELRILSSYAYIFFNEITKIDCLYCKTQTAFIYYRHFYKIYRIETFINVYEYKDRSRVLCFFLAHRYDEGVNRHGICVTGLNTWPQVVNKISSTY